MFRVPVTSSSLIFLVVFGWPAFGQKASQKAKVENVAVGLRPKGDLLEMPAVRKELRLSADQQERLTRIGEMRQRAARERRDATDDITLGPDPDANAALIVDRLSTDRVIRERFEAESLKVLGRDQFVRLDQIQLQVEGPFGLLRPENQVRLNLDPGQVERINELVALTRAERRRLLDKPGDVVREIRSRRPPGQEQEKRLSPSEMQLLEAAEKQVAADQRQFRGSVDRRVGAILSKKQRELYQKMRGEPFEMAPNAAEKTSDGKTAVKKP